MDISVEDWGFGFVLETFKRFQGDGVFFLYFVVSVGVIAFFVME